MDDELGVGGLCVLNWDGDKVEVEGVDIVGASHAIWLN